MTITGLVSKPCSLVLVSQHTRTKPYNPLSLKWRAFVTITGLGSKLYSLGSKLCLGSKPHIISAS